MDEIFEAALAWHRAGRAVVLAHVVETWGSAPCPAGSMMVVADDGQMLGSVSGGCIEGAVVAEAGAAAARQRSQLFNYGISDETAFAQGLACGGQIQILVEPLGPCGMPVEILARLVEARAARRALAYCADLVSGTRAVREPGQDPDIDTRFRTDRSGREGARFIAIHNPAPRLVVVGAVHIAQMLVPMAQACGYHVTLVDPRAAFATPARFPPACFPNLTLCEAWPGQALEALALDARTAVVTLTHDAKLDDPAIAVALQSECFYLGALGSSRTQAKRVERLLAAGFKPDQLARLHAPVGLRIGAISPAEIAVSILAEITQVLRQGTLSQ